MITLFEWTYMHWITLGVALLAIEISLGIGFLLWLSMGALIVGLINIVLPNLSYFTQCIMFSVWSIVSGILWWKYQRGSFTETASPNLNNKMQRLIGEIGVVDVAIINGIGKIKIGDTLWKATGEDLPVGTKIQVISKKGKLLVVKKC
ncbi:MAG: NfeD family protein [Legionellales bacterium]|nr:NfeD family protein [Legionellales bacterium]